MTGIADFYLYLKRPNKHRQKRLLAHFVRRDPLEAQRFVVLAWKRTGSNLLCGALHLHPDILMHNELFNPIDIFTYHPQLFQYQQQQQQQQQDLLDNNNNKEEDTPPRWSVLTRDLFPVNFLDYIWSQRTVDKVKPGAKAVGFKSFPDHWIDTRNEVVWQEHVLEDLQVKKIVLFREDELAVYVSMQRADMTGRYLTHSYPKDLKIRVEPDAFQSFVNNYRNTYQHKYQSPIAGRDTFYITYEQLADEEYFAREIFPRLCGFLGVREIHYRPLKETVRQAYPDEDLADVIENYDELEKCFRHTDVLHFQKRREALELKRPADAGAESSSVLRNDDDDTGLLNNVTETDDTSTATTKTESTDADFVQSWSILLPICSRSREAQTKPVHNVRQDGASRSQFNANRFLDVTLSSQHNQDTDLDPEIHWNMLQRFCDSLGETTTSEQCQLIECIVGIDKDDRLYQQPEAKNRIKTMLKPCCKEVVFVDISPHMYGHVCKIWNFLASKAKNDFLVLLGDDIELLDQNWQPRIVQEFDRISKEENLPFGCACVAIKDMSFPGFPTFPVVHRWHIEQFGSLLPKQFSNQGGDPYLYELYSRFNAASFCVSCRLENTIGGDGDARYVKHHINWRGQILSMNIRKLKKVLDLEPPGIVLDVVVPSYRVDNNDYLERIASLRCTMTMYVRFWFVVDNPDEHHVASVKQLAKKLNESQLDVDCNYFVNVIHYGANRGASYARNTGFNYTTADWVLFLDDDVIPDIHLLDAYAGAIRRYPGAKVFVGLTELPEPCNLWTQMMRTCNVGYFYSIAQRMVHPSWGVTANLMVRGARYNSTIQFKNIYPKTGGGEDIDFVYQFKQWYGDERGNRVTVGIPEAQVHHPWWNSAKPCYKQVIGWAWGDSLCITEWKQKTFLAFPNWVEFVTFLLPPCALYTGNVLAGAAAGLSVIALEHAIKTFRYFPEARRICPSKSSIWRSMWVGLGAGSVLSAQEVTRVAALIRRGSFFSLFRRVDWFDGEKGTIKLDIQLNSVFRFALDVGLSWSVFKMIGRTRSP